jgi:hypothetical protein
MQWTVKVLHLQQLLVLLAVLEGHVLAGGTTSMKPQYLDPELLQHDTVRRAST